MKKSKNNYTVKDFFYKNGLIPPAPSIDTSESLPYIPVALYIKAETQNQLNYLEFMYGINLEWQGLKAINTYLDYEGAHGSSSRSGLKNLINDLYTDHNWFFIVVDKEENFPVGTKERFDIREAERVIPVLTMNEVMNFNRAKFVPSTLFE